jgi:rhodanese-related sulfurtransferase
MKSITCTALRQMAADKKDFQLIDVREPDEHEAFNIGGELIPLGEIALHTEKIKASAASLPFKNCRINFHSIIYSILSAAPKHGRRKRVFCNF